MDPQLPAQLVQLLAPFLPYLLKGVKLAGQEAARKLGEKAGEQGFEQAQALWDRLRPKMEARPAALEAAQDAAAHPDDEDALAALRLQLKNCWPKTRPWRRNLPACCRNPASPGRPSSPAATVLWRSVAV